MHTFLATFFWREGVNCFFQQNCWTVLRYIYVPWFQYSFSSVATHNTIAAAPYSEIQTQEPAHRLKKWWWEGLTDDSGALYCWNGWLFYYHLLYDQRNMRPVNNTRKLVISTCYQYIFTQNNMLMCFLYFLSIVLKYICKENFCRFQVSPHLTIKIMDI